MKNTLRLAFRKGDVLAILLVLALAGGTAWAFAAATPSQPGQIVQVFQDTLLIAELPLDTDQTLRIDGTYQNTLRIHNGRAAIVQSDCPGADCVHSGWIDSAARSIVCLPNRVEIRICAPSDVDFVVR